MNILILSPNQLNRKNWTHAMFRLEIGKQHNTTYYGDGYPEYVSSKSIPEFIKDKNFDLILTYGMRYTEPFIGLGDITNIPKAHIAVDYFPNSCGGTYERNHILFKRDKYNLYFGVVGNIVRNLEKNGVCKKAHLLPFSVDTNIYNNQKVTKQIDIFACFTTRSIVYPNRVKVQNLIKSFKDLKSFTGTAEHQKYINLINKSRICITSNNKFKSLSIKYYEILACGSFLLADKPEDFDELGFIDEKHLVLYNDLNDLRDKIYYYAKNYKRRELIARQGLEFVRKNHNNSIRVQQFTEIIKKEFNIK